MPRCEYAEEGARGGDVMRGRQADAASEVAPDEKAAHAHGSEEHGDIGRKSAPAHPFRQRDLR